MLVHIAAISIGLLIALGLEATVQWVHHKHQAQQALELLKSEIERNRIALKNDMRSGDIGERDHRAALAVLHRLRSSTLRPDDRLIFIRKFSPLGSTAWRVVHESGAAAYISYVLMAKYGEIYEAQQRINDGAMSVYADLQRATAVLNAETEDQSRAAGQPTPVIGVLEAEFRKAASRRNELVPVPESASSWPKGHRHCHSIGVESGVAGVEAERSNGIDAGSAFERFEVASLSDH